MWYKISQVPHTRGQVGGSRSGVEGVGGGLKLPFRHNGTGCVSKELSMVLKPRYKVKQYSHG